MLDVRSKAVTRGVFWVFEHSPKFQRKIRHTKTDLLLVTKFSKVTTGLTNGVSFCSEDVCFYAFYKLGNAPKSVSSVALPRTPLGKLTVLPQTPVSYTHLTLPTKRIV